MGVLVFTLIIYFSIISSFLFASQSTDLPSYSYMFCFYFILKIIKCYSRIVCYCKDKHCHWLCLQETHRAKGPARPSIPGMTLLAERPHNKHGSSVFDRDGLKVNSIYVCEEDNVEFITVELPGVLVHSVYKPPDEQFLLPPPGSRNMPHIVIGDFNSHNTLWGYTSTDNDGEAVELWAESNNLSLIHNAKLPK